MSYRLPRGIFAVGIINSGQDTGVSTLTKLTIDEVRTSAGTFHTNKMFIENGLAFSDLYTYDTGGGSPNLNPNAGHCPATTGGFGYDLIDGYSNGICGGAVGCAKYINNELAVYYYEFNDENHTINSSICVVL
jgi:hypothetical protein